jgi:S-adenosylmethionine decarboxylase
MNGLLPDGHYFTIHITPEPDFSYVSFETNVSNNQYQELIRKILHMFNPGKFTTTIFGGTVRRLWRFFFLKFFIGIGNNKS